MENRKEKLSDMDDRSKDSYTCPKEQKSFKRKIIQEIIEETLPRLKKPTNLHIEWAINKEQLILMKFANPKGKRES